MGLNTLASLNRLRVATAVMLLLAALVAGGCGGGQLEGQDAATTATQAAAPPTTPTTATTPPANATKPRDRSSSSVTPATTQARTTTQPPVTTPATNTPPTTTTQPAQTTSQSATDSGTAIDEIAQLTLLSKQSATEYTQQGTVSGTFDGEMLLTVHIENAGIAVRFTVTTAEGTVRGHGLAIVRITGAALEPITGTAAIDGGTGRFAGVRGKGLEVKGRVALDASRGTVHLAGTVFL